MSKKSSQLNSMVFELMAGYTDSAGVTHTEVEIREMTGADEEAIAKAEIRTNMGKVLTTLLSNCTLRIGTLEREHMKPSQWDDIMNGLFLGDRDLILMKIRELTYGQEMEFETRCSDSSCRKTLTVSFGIDELEIRPVVGNPAAIEFSLPRGYNDGTEVHKNGLMRMPTGFDQEQLDAIARKNPGLANTTLITRCVTELGTLKLSSKIFRELSQRDREYLVETLSEHVFGPKFTVNVVCEHCGNAFDAGVNPLNFIL